MAAFTALAIAALAVSVYGQVKAGKAAKKQGEAQQEASESQAGLADYNAGVADLQAQDALDRGTNEENRFRASVDGMVGAQRAGIAGSNIDVAFGSALDVQADARFLGELDALTIRTNAAREAWGFRVQGEDLRTRAAIARKEGGYYAEAGRAAATSAYIGAAGTVIGGSSSMLQQRYGFGNAGGGSRPIGGQQTRNNLNTGQGSYG